MASVSGCCGGASSHKCDFTPPGDTNDGGGSDANLPCGTTICPGSQVCCVKKAPVVAYCVDPPDFVADGCLRLDLPCNVPADCPAGLGLVCCVVLNPGAVTCAPPQVCPGDGVNTYRACAVDGDCPSHAIGSCYALGSGDDGGTISICLQ